MEDYEIIKYSQDECWFIAKIKGRYYFFDAMDEEDMLVETPSGKIMQTSYYQLAERILEDLATYGDEYMTAESIIPWHCTMIDNFVSMEHEQIEEMLDECFLQACDWTYAVGRDDIFGDKEERIPTIRKWLSKCTHMQMTAVCCIGNAYHSINIAFVLAALMENYSGKALRKQFKALAEIVEENALYDDLDSIMKVFDTFNLYYGIHGEEEGAITNVELSIVEKEDNNCEIVVSEEMLVGRNFYHYTDGECDDEQPFVLETDLSHLEYSDEEDEDDDEYDDEFDDEEDDSDEEYKEYLPHDCWVKKISAFEDDEVIYYHIIIEVKDGFTTNISVVKDEVSRSIGGMFFFPGMTMPAVHFYDEIDADDYPEAVDNELEALKKKRYLPNNFSFMGKKLPQRILDKGGNGGDMTDHTYAIQSAYRLAYTHMSIVTTEDGIIEDFDYSSYQSTGSEYGDVFSRPLAIKDKHKEIVDMLLYILDLYTEEEIAVTLQGEENGVN